MRDVPMRKNVWSVLGESYVVNLGELTLRGYISRTQEVYLLILVFYIFFKILIIWSIIIFQL